MNEVDIKLSNHEYKTPDFHVPSSIVLATRYKNYFSVFSHLSLELILFSPEGKFDLLLLSNYYHDKIFPVFHGTLLLSDMLIGVLQPKGLTVK